MGFAQNLDHLMQMLGMTKYQLAKELGCHQTSVANWLENGTMPHKRTIEAVASVFGITSTELCADEIPVLRKKEKPAPSGGDRLNPLYYELSPENREFIDSMIEKLLKSQSGD